MAAEEVCGKCGGPVVERLPSTKRRENNKHYHKKCSLCEHIFPIHHNCVISLCKEYSMQKGKEDVIVTPSQWVGSREIKFRCRLCCTPCFICQKSHKAARNRYIADCSQCKVKWCYMLPGCVSNGNDEICINCVDTTKYKKVMHKGSTVKIPFWYEMDVTLPKNVTYVSNIQ